MKNKKNMIVFGILLFIIAGMFDSCSGGYSSSSSSGSKYGNTCRMCGRSISSTQSVKTHGYCKSCAKMLSERIK